MNNICKSGFACFVVLLGMLSGVNAATISIEFDSLPSNQGWTFVGNSLPEETSFMVDGVTLTQTTVGAGSDVKAFYRKNNIVNSSKEMSLSFTARVVGFETSGDAVTQERGFNVMLLDRWAAYRIAVTNNAVMVNKKQFELDTSVFHDYVFASHPSGQVNLYNLFIDGNLVMEGGSGSGADENVIYFGDSSNAENSHIEITAFSFDTAGGAMPDIAVEMMVDNAFPNTNEPVEFTVTVRNVGSTAAEDVVIFALLPGEMSIPAGAAAIASIGNYNPATGEWVIGKLDIGIDATLVLPALVTASQPPACIANFAYSNHPRDLNSLNDEALVPIHLDTNQQCVDLGINFMVRSDSNFLFPICDSQDRYSGEVQVNNDGPDAARNIEVVIIQSPVLGPNLRFDDSVCLNAPGARCDLPDIAAGGAVTIGVTSDLYQSYNSVEQTINVRATTSGTDYRLSNNTQSGVDMVGGFSNCDLLEGIPEIGTVPGCFIATAAFGSSMHPYLNDLRDFRDRFMMTNRPGRVIVAFYYHYSAPLADYIAQRDWLRSIVRGILTPIVYMIRYPLLAALLVISLILVVITRRRQQSRVGAG
jgi:uncharacterized repeat protein (TIGR01451 family)